MGVLWVGALLHEKGLIRERYSFHLPPLACPSIPECLCIIINTLDKNILFGIGTKCHKKVTK